jgi:hypothetical protein
VPSAKREDPARVSFAARDMLIYSSSSQKSKFQTRIFPDPVLAVFVDLIRHSDFACLDKSGSVIDIGILESGSCRAGIWSSLLCYAT